MAPFYSSVPVSHDSATVSQYVQNQHPETGAAKWNSLLIINFIISTCAFLPVTCQNVFCEQAYYLKIYVLKYLRFNAATDFGQMYSFRRDDSI